MMPPKASPVTTPRQAAASSFRCNGLGQLIAEHQSRSGAVNVNSMPKVQYAFTEISGGTNHSRLTSTTYPDGYVVNYNYSSGLNDTSSRLSDASKTALKPILQFLLQALLGR
jgi:hypothetical protein